MKRRLRRILKGDDRIFIVAMDHPLVVGPMPGLEDPRRAIAQVVKGGPDAIMTTFGTIRACEDLLADVGLILTLESRGPVAGYGVEQALRLGADAVKVLSFTDSPEQPNSISNLLQLGAEAAAWGLPLVAEMVPVSMKAKDEHTPEKIAKAARVGAECGADLVKVHFTGDTASFAKVVQGCPVPVVILGGGKGDDRTLLEAAVQALGAGAAGVAFGRNIWQHENPEGITRAVAAIVHQGVTVDEALGMIKGR